ncbi:efflux transporter outer membrane subunit [Biostraticola tofi]|uniref:NodT family efflux transporter outer membrane factor (OMF) lipoprotein n=1 Tax=Biostraticola tofi TaxID=466109 RepID=A0A4R3Z5F9_9GAMM|nr:efflux transporter outer membrane subunit [Biostraticola tofi]TCW00463.1 NodT family efflux transporter outer membrane factor (OMF) lipoprotein [Biostraticola tofi]
MPSRIHLLSLCSALVLAGCAMPNGLHTQGRALDASSLASQHTLSGATLSSAHWPAVDWWNTLGDRQLDVIIRHALQNSPDLQVADARARQASASVLAAEAERLPTLDANAGMTRSRNARVDDPNGMGKQYGTLRTLSAHFNYTFDLWGGQRAAWEAAVGRANAAEVDRQAARLTLAADVARAYNTYGHAWALVSLAELDLKRTKTMLDLASRRYNAGLDSKFQYQQTESLEASAEATLTDARQQVRTAGIRLAVLMGQGPDGAERLPRPKLIAPESVSLPPQLPAELLGRRPDLVAARWRVEAATKDIKVSRTAFYPNLNLTAAAGTKSLLGDAFFGAPSRYFSIGPALSLPIFDGGRRRADLAGSNADYDLAVAQYNQSLVDALGDIGDAISRLASMETQIQQQRRARDIAQASWDSAMERYSAGIGNYIDALSVEQQLIQSERELASITADRTDTAILLMQALGGGYQNSGPSTATSTVAAN